MPHRANVVAAACVMHWLLVAVAQVAEGGMPQQGSEGSCSHVTARAQACLLSTADRVRRAAVMLL